MKTQSTPRPPKRPMYWDGHSKRGQAWYDAQFEYEKKMQSRLEDGGMYEPGGLYYGID